MALQSIIGRQLWDRVDLNELEADFKTHLMEALASYNPPPQMQLQPLHHCKLHAGVISVGICQM